MTQGSNKELAGVPPAKLSMDIEHIKSLIQLMIENDLSRMELREGDVHILLRRGQPVVATTIPTATPVVAAPAPSGAAPLGGAPGGAEKETYIRSPMVGTFYASPGPEAAPFVSVGSVVEPETVVCLIEAMKVFNEIKSDISGRITKVLVKNGEAVEFDQPLFAVGPV